MPFYECKEMIGAIKRASSMTEEELIEIGDVYGLMVKDNNQDKDYKNATPAWALTSYTLRALNPKNIFFGTLRMESNRKNDECYVGDYPLKQEIESARYIEMHCSVTRWKIPRLITDIGRSARYLASINAQKRMPYVVGYTHQDMVQLVKKLYGDCVYPVSGDYPEENMLLLQAVLNASRRANKRHETIAIPSAIVIPTQDFIDIGQNF